MLLAAFISLLLTVHEVLAKIDRKAVVEQFNPKRTASDTSTPLQVGNGDFAFGADITGLQTFLPYNTLTAWCWHNSSLPTTPNQTQPSDYTGLDLWTHGRLVNYNQPNPKEADITRWMIANPHRVNVGRLGLWFGDHGVNETHLEDRSQVLHLYNGTIYSSFRLNGSEVNIRTIADPASSTVAVSIDSDLLRDASIGIFLDFPYATDKAKFEAPFVGLFNATANHTTNIVQQNPQQARVEHNMDATTYYTTVQWNQQSATFSRESPHDHKYILKPRDTTSLHLTVSWHPEYEGATSTPSVDSISSDSAKAWANFWEQGAFIDLTCSKNATAIELQRRIIQSLYNLAVNNAGSDPPQESGLVNNGWYGKFHAEMFPWNVGQWARWDRWDLFRRSMPGIYERFLPTSIERARKAGYKGAKWGKMSDPSGRSAPGDLNSLLIWQQPHPMHLAEYEWRSFPHDGTLAKWDNILKETADYLSDFAYWNETTGVYDLGPPMYPVSENTIANETRNAAFEIAYWRFALDVALKWQARQGKQAPKKWRDVMNRLAPLPQDDGVHVIYEGIPDMWHNKNYTEDHQSMLMLYGWLPPVAGFNISVMQATVDKVYGTWNFTYSYGWDFPVLAMNAARMGHVEKAIDFLVDPSFKFDDAGYHIGGPRVATPYMPGASSLLWAIAMMAGGWQDNPGPRFPDQWKVEVEGFQAAI
ncbi:uncharacterized protein MYCFIDRAFT_34214 [Pseudocercospora fijiensis CIRAD86]|uniref:Glycoside hydrolase family 65 protein n=1 Tax=Pseudocercospora fijiensis (strain CIRAD86) TaxID=383855 RepID=M3A3G4_PSEFD|nr:uncharacterized protein MYCFIDRAFT_34214 [Pseudocercospora fijiensis CIRAD86]EME79181.1 hypothetical protein MYCFIDRAFT_34214 [Pseudocercospora fijiensis CIRAD86]